MPLISIRLPERLLKALDDLVERGVFQSRAEAIRYAIRIMLDSYKYGLLKGGANNG